MHSSRKSKFESYLLPLVEVLNKKFGFQFSSSVYYSRTQEKYKVLLPQMVGCSVKAESHVSTCTKISYDQKTTGISQHYPVHGIRVSIGKDSRISLPCVSVFTQMYLLLCNFAQKLEHTLIMKTILSIFLL